MSDRCGRRQGSRRVPSPVRQVSIRSNMAKVSKWVFERGCIGGVWSFLISDFRGLIMTLDKACIIIFFWFILLSLNSVALQTLLVAQTILILGYKPLFDITVFVSCYSFSVSKRVGAAMWAHGTETTKSIY
ncbi:hypothetical protein V8E53_006172 [Lactarius tabidus]